MDRHVVIGGTGAVGSAVVSALADAGLPAAAVARRGKVKGIEFVQADVTDQAATTAATRGATHVYLCVAVPYSTAAWEETWPVVVENVVNACATAGARLVFFDNVDMYGPPPLPVPFSETTSQQSPGGKGKVRKQLADSVLAANRDGRCPTLVARSANFIGPGMFASPLYTGFIESMLAGNRPKFLSRTNVPHTYAYTLDNGRAMVELATADDAFGEVWHLPVSRAVTIDELATMVGDELGRKKKVLSIPPPARRLLGRFMPIVREVEGMMHHFDNPYIMSWEKFQRRFPDLKTTPIEEALKVTLQSLRQEA